MGLLETLFVIFKAIWPFLRESLFEGRTFRNWLRRYKWTFTWLSMVVVLTTLVFYFFDETIRLQVERNRLYADNVALYRKNKAMTAQVVNLQKELTTTKKLLEAHRSWEQRCGQTPAVIEKGGAACPVPKTRTVYKTPVKPNTGRKPAPPKPKPNTVRQKFRDLFGD